MIETFRSPFIFHTLIPNHEEIKRKYLPIIQSTLNANKSLYYMDRKTSDWNSNVYTSFQHELSFLRDSELMNSIVWGPVDELLEEAYEKNMFDRYPTSSSCNMIWFNYYEPGGFQEVHEHLSIRASFFSGIYLLHNEEPNTTAFSNFNPNPYLTETKTTQNFPEGTVMIFPTCLLHYVNPVSKPRYTISFNVTSVC